MSRELSYVIACLQEIELAVAVLKTKTTEDHIKDVDAISALVRHFFQAPGVIPAEKIQSTLQQYSAASAPWMQQSLIIDGLTTTLSGLCDELTEVLEDLG